jgi:hypothetical protein
VDFVGTMIFEFTSICRRWSLAGDCKYLGLLKRLNILDLRDWFKFDFCSSRYDFALTIFQSWDDFENRYLQLIKFWTANYKQRKWKLPAWAKDYCVGPLRISDCRTISGDPSLRFLSPAL